MFNCIEGRSADVKKIQKEREKKEKLQRYKQVRSPTHQSMRKVEMTNGKK